MAENSANKPSTSFFKRLAGSPAGGGDNAKPPSKKPNLDGADGAQGNEEATVKTKEDAENIYSVSQVNSGLVQSETQSEFIDGKQVL